MTGVTNDEIAAQTQNLKFYFISKFQKTLGSQIHLGALQYCGCWAEGLKCIKPCDKSWPTFWGSCVSFQITLGQVLWRRAIAHSIVIHWMWCTHSATDATEICGHAQTDFIAGCWGAENRLKLRGFCDLANEWWNHMLQSFEISIRYSRSFCLVIE